MTLAAGTKLGPYGILAPLGAGGMGEVYRARDTRLGRDVAIKVLPAHLAATPEVRARFDREARAVSSLNHPHICTLFDVGHQDGVDYLVMEHLDGETLAARLARGPLATPDLLRFAIEIAEALDAAHRAGIVHRDLKPGNVMLTKGGTKLLDFGLARATGLGAAGADVTQSPTVSRPLTAEGTIVGTFQYMSPEQLEGGEADARSDLFAFGAVLYEMATGKRAFEGKSQASLIAAILDKDPPPISSVAPLAPPALDRVVQRCLAKSPDDRWQTARDLASELKWVRDDSSGTGLPAVAPSSGSAAADSAARSPAPASTSDADDDAAAARRAKKAAAGRRLATALAIVAAGLAATKQVIRLVKPRAPQLNAQMTLRTVKLPLTQVGYPGFSQDGKWIALPAADETGKWDVYFMNVNGGEVRRITSDPGFAADYADVSPDGSQVAYGVDAPTGRSQIRVVSSLGGASRLVAEDGTGPHWSPDGERVGYQLVPTESRSGKLELWSVRSDGTDNRVDYVDSLCANIGRISFSWSPDGKRIAWLRSYQLGGYQELIVRTLATGEERQLTHDRKNIDEVCWTRQDEIVFSSNRAGNSNLWMVRASGGPLAQVTTGIGPDIGMRISADGKTLLYLQTQPISHLWIADVETGTAQQVTHDDLRLGGASLSPDRQRIAVSIFDPDPIRRSGHIFVMNRDGSDRRQVTVGDETATGPQWSPDGKWLAYVSNQGAESPESTSVFLIDPASPGTPRRLASCTSAFWIDDSTLSVSTRTNSSRLSLISGTTSSVSEDSTFDLDIPAESYSVYIDIHRGREGAWLRPRSGGAVGESAAPRRILPLSVRFFGWLRDGNYLLCSRDSGAMFKLTLPEGKEEPIAGRFSGLTLASGGSTSRDGKEVAYLEPRTASKLVLIENLR